MIRFWLKLTLIFLATSGAAPLTYAQKNSTLNQAFESQAQALITKMRIPVAECPERVWPEYTWSGKNYGILIVDTEAERAIFWDLKLDKVTSAKFKELPVQTQGTYGVFNYQDRTTLSVNTAVISKLSSERLNRTADLADDGAFFLAARL